MPTDRFIIKFDTDTGNAIVALERLARKVEQIESRMNLMGGRTRSGPTGARLQFTRFTAENIRSMIDVIEKETDDGVQRIERVSKRLINQRDRLFAELAGAKQRGAGFTEIGGIASRLTGTLQQIAAAQATLGQSTTRTMRQINQLARETSDFTKAQQKSLPVFDAQTEKLLKARNRLLDLGDASQLTKRQLQQGLDINSRLASRFSDAAVTAQQYQARLRDLGSMQQRSLPIWDKQTERALKTRDALLALEAAGQKLNKSQLQRGVAANQVLAPRFADAAADVVRYQQALGNMVSAQQKSVPIFDAQTEALLKQRTALNSMVATHAQSGARLSRARIQEAFNVNTTLAQRGFRDAARDAQLLGLELDRTAISANRFATNFGFHARRVAEGIVLYQAFELAVRGAATALDLVAQTDREMTRLELVLGGISESGADKFLTGMTDIAVDTNTSFLDLLQTTDLVASALSNLPASERETGILRFQELVGQFSNLLGPGTNQQQLTAQLIPILKALNGDLDTFAGFLDKVTVAANRNAFEVEGIITAFSQAGTAIRASGFDVEFAILLFDELIKSSGESASEIGNLFNNVIGRVLKSPDQIQDALDEVADGFFNVRDAAGNIKGVDRLLLEMVAAEEKGIITSGQLTEALTSLTGPLAPGKVGFVNVLAESIGTALERSSELDDAFGALKEASDELVDTLAGRFGQLIQKVIAGIVEFREELGAILGVFLAFGNAFVDFVGFLGPGFGQIAGITASLLLLGKSLAFAGGIAKAFFASLSAASALRAAGGLQTLGRVATPTNIALGAGAVAAARQGRAFQLSGDQSKGLVKVLSALPGFAGTAAVAIAGLVTSLGKLLPLLAAFMAFDFAGQISEGQTALQGIVGQQAVGLDERGLRALRERVQGQMVDPLAMGVPGPFDIAFNRDRLEHITSAAAVNPALTRSLEEIDRLLGIVQEKGPNATITVEDLGESFGGLGEVGTEMADIGEDIQAMFDEILNSTQQVNEATEQANTIFEINTALADERVAALETLNQRLADGLITQQQYNEGTTQIATASEQAAQLVALYGEQLGQIPLLEAAAQQGADTLAGALFNLIVQSGDSAKTIENLIGKLIALGRTQQAVAESIFRNPIHIRAVLTMATQRIDSTTAGNNPELLKAQRFSQQQLGTSISGVKDQVSDLMNDLSRIFNSGSNQIFGSGVGSSSSPRSPSGSTAAARQVSVVDIGDLSAAQVSQIISMATALRNKIPGETAASADAIATLIKDGEFLRNVRGIDDRLLRIAIEELVEVEKDRLEQERQKAMTENVLRNLVTRVGPLGALITQPTFAGVGGNLVGNNGLNFDPSQGNFVINVPVELRGLEPSKLQTIIYQTVAKAIQDAMRLGS